MSDAEIARLKGALQAAAETAVAKDQECRRLTAEIERLRAALNGTRPLPLDRDTLGRMVREAWVRWALTQPNPKPSWLVPYDELAEPDKEADRQIGEAVARWTLIHDAARAALPQPPAIDKEDGE